VGLVAFPRPRNFWNTNLNILSVDYLSYPILKSGRISLIKLINPENASGEEVKNYADIY